MVTAITKKIITSIPLLLIVSILMFGIIHLLPGDATTIILSDASVTEAQKASIKSELGLDQPIHIQYWNWLSNFIKGNMGRSFLSNQPVARRITERLPVSLELIFFSIILAILIGLPIGMICAVNLNKPVDYFFSTVSMIGIAMPSFWLGMLFIMFLAVNLKWLPASGFMRFSVNPETNLKTMLMPSVTLALSLAAPIARQTRSSMLDALHQDFVYTAIAKGLPDIVVFWKHALRNALIPVITAISSQISSMIGGVFVIETLFLLPGMGKCMVDAIYQRDYPVIMAIAMVVVSGVVLINMVVDILYIVIDPRISKSAR